VLLDAEWGLPAPERGLAGRLVDFARTVRLKAPHRQILRAYYKGQADAARLVARTTQG
jgi:hypothetical protein